MKKLTPEQEYAKKELDDLTKDINGPYFNQAKKFTSGQQDKAVKRAQELRLVIETQQPVQGNDPDYILTREEAMAWKDKIIGNKEHPYWNPKATVLQRDLSVEFVNRLSDIIDGKTNTIEGYVEQYHTKRQEEAVKVYGPGYNESQSLGHGGWSPHEDRTGEQTQPNKDGG